MPGTLDLPVAARATAFIGPSRWLRRPVRMVRYDACWPDGRVEFNVSLSKAMYRGWPADFAPVSDSVHAHCPDVGTGQWVDERGQVTEGPALGDPNPPLRGIPRQHGATRRDLTPKARLAWRLGGGAALIGLGVLLLAGPAGDGIGGAVGAVCCLSGVAVLAGLVPKSRRRW
jgi:hypothetical protein